MKRIILTVLAFSLVLAACSDDDPVQPGPDPVPDPVATSPDSLMALYRIAVEDMDADLYGQLLTPEFRMAVSAWEGNFPDLLTDHMTKDEVLTAAANMFGGQSIMNWEGDSVPAVDRLTIHQWEKITDWAAKDGSENPVPGTVSSLWAIRLFVERGASYPILAVAGLYRVEVQAQPTTGGDGSRFAMTSLELVPDGKSESFGWAGAHLVYLTNEAPTAVLEMTEEATEPWPTYTFDPSGSLDDDSGLADLPFRYRIGTEPFMPPENWTDWSGDPLEIVFESEAEHTVTLEVRDRWGATAQASKTVQPARTWLPFPATSNQLMANFVATYQNRDFGEFRRLLHDDYLMILQQETIDQFPDLGQSLGLDEELRIAERMFSGDDLTDPNGYFVPAVQDISFERFEALDAWRVSPSDDPIPDAYFAPYDVEIRFNRGQAHSQIHVQGQIRFYVTSRDSLHEGTLQQYHEMVGQVDLTTINKAVEGATWGGTKALYR